MPRQIRGKMPIKKMLLKFMTENDAGIISIIK